MNEYEFQVALDRRQLRAPHAFNLLGHILNIELVGNFARVTAKPADRSRLLLGPQQDVIIVERTHRSAVYHTNRLCSTAAPMNDANSGCGANGRDLSSGWNCTPMNQGWSWYSIISGNRPSGDMPAKRMPCCSRRSL